MKINISNTNLMKNMNESCKSQRKKKNNMNFIVQSLACVISVHNILTSYAEDFYFQSNQKIPFIGD